jgi:hypothetical protein
MKLTLGILLLLLFLLFTVSQYLLSETHFLYKFHDFELSDASIFPRKKSTGLSCWYY